MSGGPSPTWPRSSTGGSSRRRCRPRRMISPEGSWRRGARTALVTTAGFRDVLEIGRQARPDLYDLGRRRPPALVPRELRFVVRERMGPEGEVEPLDEDSLAAAVQ